MVPQDEALSALTRLMSQLGMPPTVAEYRDALGVGSTRTALRYLRDLETAGHIWRWPGARGIAIGARPVVRR